MYFHLIFSCADGNLRTYWGKKRFPKFDKETVLWAIRQMSGIASALNCVHNFETTFDLKVEGGARFPNDGVMLRVKEGEEKYGRHGDIKPENILWFRQPPDCKKKDKEGILQITDFGLGRFHGRDSRSNVDPRRVMTSPTYEPPECKLERPVSRAYDIWSLACLFLEFATWLLEGTDQIEAFANARGQWTGIISDDNFFTIFSDENNEKDAQVRRAVIGWVDRLHAHDRCSQLIHDLLDLVMKNLLRTNPAERMRAETLNLEMKKLVRNAESNNTYLVESAPRPMPTPPAVHKLSTSRRVHFADHPYHTWPQQT
jgi:serine/threonine protein kinase